MFNTVQSLQGNACSPRNRRGKEFRRCSSETRANTIDAIIIPFACFYNLHEFGNVNKHRQMMHQSEHNEQPAQFEDSANVRIGGYGTQGTLDISYALWWVLFPKFTEFTSERSCITSHFNFRFVDCIATSATQCLEVTALSQGHSAEFRRQATVCVTASLLRRFRFRNG